MGRYRLSKAADADFEGVFIYGLDHFGVDQAIHYQTDLKQRFQKIADQPRFYPAVDHIREGYRRSICGVHSIYYRIDPDEVVIVRILGRQNFDDTFERLSI